MNTTSLIQLGVAVALLTGMAACNNEPAAPAVTSSGPTGLAWAVRGDGGGNWPEEKAKLQAFGEQFETSWALYEKLKADAGGGQPITWAQLALPAYDWSGVYSRSTITYLDLDLPMSNGPDTTSAQLNAAGQAIVAAKRAALEKTGGEYDPLSDCRPPGTPRWFTEPFLHEFIVTPHQTWLINEMVNDIRRVYTDGREHTADEDAYPSWNGDTIGFWDGDTLVTHTKHLKAGQYQRGAQPDYSEQVTLVERWRKVDAKTLQADLWVFDPVYLAKPWYTRQSWTQLTNDDHLLRLRYWDCRENANNAIITTEEGTSQFPDFDFVEDDAANSTDESVRRAQQERASGAAAR